MSTWILVANASEARLYSTENSHHPKLRTTQIFSHPETRQKMSDISSDHHSRYQGKGNWRSGAFEEPNQKTAEATKFAKELATALKAGHNSHSYDELILIASPHFYGLLKQHINGRLRLGNVKNIQKDYTKLSEKELVRHVHGHLWG